MQFFKNMGGDKVIWVTVFLLSLVSVLVVYSSIGSLAFKYKAGNTLYYLIKHGSIIALGLVLIYLVHRMKYIYFSRLAQIGVYLSVPLLLYAMIWGVKAGDAGRWIEIPGIGLTFQPSDLAKLSLVCYVARLLSLKRDVLPDFRKGFLPIIIPIVVICGLIFPTNFSTAALLFVTCMMLLFIGRVPWKFLGLTIAGVVLFGGIVILLVMFAPGIIPRGATWKARIESFSAGKVEGKYMDQTEMAKTAIGSSNFFVGKGLGNSDQRSFLPQAPSDFIFAMILEQMGGLTGSVIVFLYLVILFRAIRIATNCERTFGSLMAVGLGFGLVFQALINMAVAVNIFPVTGQPLPLISMGGTSIWFTSITIGILLSISRETEPLAKPAYDEPTTA